MSMGTMFSAWQNSITRFCLYALPCKMPRCQTAPLLPSVTRQQRVMEYCQEGSTFTTILPTCEAVGQHNEMEGITIGVALVHVYTARYFGGSVLAHVYVVPEPCSRPLGLCSVQSRCGCSLPSPSGSCCLREEQQGWCAHSL